MKTIDVRVKYDSKEDLTPGYIRMALDEVYVGENFTVRELPPEAGQGEDKKFTIRQIQNWLLGWILINVASKREGERYNDRNDELRFLARELEDYEDGLEAVCLRQPIPPDEGEDDKPCMCKAGRYRDACDKFMGMDVNIDFCDNCGHHKSCHAKERI